MSIVADRRASITVDALHSSLANPADVHLIQESTKKKIKGGFNFMYKNSFSAVQKTIIKSNNDVRIFWEILSKFTYKQIEVSLSARHISKDLGISTSIVTTMIMHMIGQKLLMRISRGIYRLNPFMYAPPRADLEGWQEEWTDLTYQQNQLEKAMEEELSNPTK